MGSGVEGSSSDLVVLCFCRVSQNHDGASLLCEASCGGQPGGSHYPRLRELFVPFWESSAVGVTMRIPLFRPWEIGWGVLLTS